MLDPEALARLENLFNQPGWNDFDKELQVLYDNSDCVIHDPGRKDDREINIGRCDAVKQIRSMVQRIKKDIDR